MNDPVNSPAHYTAIPARCACGRTLEPIDFTRHMGFSLGNAVKYILRAPYKGRTEEDLRKALWYINDELKKLEKPGSDSPVAGGHNPRRLTEAQVGTTEGWRLMDLGECERAEVNAPSDMEIYQGRAFVWEESVLRGQKFADGSFTDRTYRTKRPCP